MMHHFVEFNDLVIIEWWDNRSVATICRQNGYTTAEVVRTWSFESQEKFLNFS